MKVSLKWLNQFVKIDDINPQTLADAISLCGVEVESVAKVADATGVVIGYVEKKGQHPDADKLSVCQVNLGKETVQIVCGAKNVDAGQKVPVATHGAILPGGFKIKKTKLRGQESNGMICSATELGIAANAVPDAISAGIWILPEDAPIGACAIKYLELDDFIIELGLTPNRMDLLSMYGVANDVAAILKRDLAPVAIAKIDQLPKPKTPFSITIQTDKCTAYLANLVENLTVQPANLATQIRLMATGNKPINNLVDLTNEIMFQTGLPVHAFDADKLPSKAIVVREAKNGETVITLDSQARTLAAGDIVITSGEQIIAIAGIMGSATSAVDENTKNVLFEAAIFDRRQIRQTASRLNLRTNASARFEKGIHVERIFEASALINDAFTNVATQTAGNFEAPTTPITLFVAAVNAKLGTAFGTADIEKILSALNLAYQVADTTFTVIPSTRTLDVACQHDLIEEIARIYGFNKIPATLPAVSTVGGYTKEQKLIRNLHNATQAAGLQNAITYSLTSENKLGQCLASPEVASTSVSLAMPLSAEHAHLRKSLIPSLLEVVAYNNARQIKDVHIYEIGKTYAKAGDNYVEQAVISGVLTGEIMTSKWQAHTEKVDFYRAKGLVETIINTFGLVATYEAIQTGSYLDFHPGQTATVSVAGQVIGVVGKLHPTMKKVYDLNDTFAFELALTELFAAATTTVNYTPVPIYPGITLDIAVVVDANIPVEKLITTIKQAGGSLLKSVEVFDLYTGDKVPSEMKSVAINLYYQDAHKTLTDDDILPVQTKMLKLLKNNHNATLRT